MRTETCKAGAMALLLAFAPAPQATESILTCRWTFVDGGRPFTDTVRFGNGRAFTRAEGSAEWADQCRGIPGLRRSCRITRQELLFSSRGEIGPGYTRIDLRTGAAEMWRSVRGTFARGMCAPTPAPAGSPG